MRIRIASYQVSYLIVDEADNDMDMEKVLHSTHHRYHFHLLTFYIGNRGPLAITKTSDSSWFFLKNMTKHEI